MGLFRRGTKLLKLAGGLRDCCCRPSNPEECWCPDACAYYWEFSGAGFSQETLTSTCRPIFQGFDPFRCTSIAGPDKSTVLEISFPYGLITESFTGGTPGTAHLSWDAFNGRFKDNIYLEFDHNIAGAAPDYRNFLVDLGVSDRSFGPNLGVTYSTKLQISGFPICPKAPGDLPLWGFDVRIRQVVRMSDGSDERSLSYTLLSDTSTAEFTVPAQCITDSALWCCPPFDNRSALHLPSELGLSIGSQGVTASGTLHEWSGDGGADPQLGDAWKTDEYPLTESNQSPWLSVTVKKKSFCRAGDCDCNQSLTGMTVTFEGKTFTYGTLESITEGVDTWEQVVTGLFRRITRETCNGNYVASVKTADISCQTIDGDDFWVVFLGSECYERDEATCPAADDARRVMQWTGVFTCGPDGQPSGSPHSATDVDDPPDLDSNTTVGTPAAECAADSTIPAISLG